MQRALIPFFIAEIPTSMIPKSEKRFSAAITPRPHQSRQRAPPKLLHSLQQAGLRLFAHGRRAGLLDPEVLTVSGATLGENLDWWEGSERRAQLRRLLKQRDGIDPEDVILVPEEARKRGLTSTVCFPTGNLAPLGSVIKSTSIDPSVVGADGVYRITGPARVFLTEAAAIAAIKQGNIHPGDVIALICRGPLGSGMEETYQITSALKHLDFGKHVAVITDARFSGVSTGACIGHVSPEALAGASKIVLLERSHRPFELGKRQAVSLPRAGDLGATGCLAVAHLARLRIRLSHTADPRRGGLWRIPPGRV